MQGSGKAQVLSNQTNVLGDAIVLPGGRIERVGVAGFREVSPLSNAGRYRHLVYDVQTPRFRYSW